MDEATKQQILEKAKSWWREELAKSHEKNTLKLTSVKEFSINPFLWLYLANYFGATTSRKHWLKYWCIPEY